MKRKLILLTVISGIVTLSFTFASKGQPADKSEKVSSSTSNEPAGGFESDDKI